MRVIVSLLKLFVGAAFLIYAALLAFILGGSLFGLTQGWWGALGGFTGLSLAVVSFVMLVLFTGMVALMISAHDRLHDLTVIMAERNGLLRERHANPTEY